MKAILAPNRDFQGKNTISQFGCGEMFYTAAEFEWTSDGEYEGEYDDVQVPKWFVTDLTSIPKPFWAILPPHGKYMAAAIVHDYLYWSQPHGYTRKKADKVFEIGMRELDVPDWKRVAIFKAVDLFGQSAWDGNTELRKNGERRVMVKPPERIQITWEEWRNTPEAFDEDQA
ncbi:MAG: DUF1353 domain-containing protein [Rhodobacteraceae bacterium]|nr:DUF1353 domain-containing protein [Paracoccaceae bacterium]